MDGVIESPAPGSEVAEGAWAGWSCYPGTDPFEDHAGPFYVRRGDDGQPVCGFEVEQRHLNGGGSAHGGALMTFADFCLFVIGGEAIRGGQAVTATFNGEFVGPAWPGDRVEGRGEVVKAGRSLVFVRGQLAVGAASVLSFSGVLKKSP